MSFASPLALLFALAAVPVVAFYLVKLRPRRVVAPTLLFWDQVFEDDRRRAMWGRLRHPLSLLTQLLFVVLIVGALAEPRLSSIAIEARQIVMIIDNGASMNGRRGDGTRLDEAKRRAIAIIDGLRPGDSMAIITAGVAPRVACGMTGRQHALRDIVDSIEPTDAPARIDDAVAVARGIAADKSNPRIIMIGDQPAEGVHVVPITGETDNVAITRFAVRRSLVDPIGYAILIEAANFGDSAVQCRIELALDDHVIDVVPLSLAPDGTWSRVVEKAFTVGGRLTATIDRDDALAADNKAFAILPRRAPFRVRFMSVDNLFLAGVFASLPLVQRTTGEADLTVFYRDVPAALPPGDLLVIAPASATDYWALGEPLPGPVVAEQDRASPLMAHVRLDHVMIPEARHIRPVDEARVLARTAAGEPIYFAITRDDGKVLVLNADLDRSDLPLRTAFPIMMSNALNWFAGGELRGGTATGSTVTFDDGTTAGPFTHVGVHPVKQGETVIEIACNLVNARESDLRRPNRFAEGEPAIAAGVGGQPIWFYLLVAACALTGVEWWLYQRRWTS